MLFEVRRSSKTGSGCLVYAPFEVPARRSSYFSFKQRGGGEPPRGLPSLRGLRRQFSRSSCAHAKQRTRNIAPLFTARSAMLRAIRLLALARTIVTPVFPTCRLFPFPTFYVVPKSAVVLCLRRPLVFPSFLPARPTGACYVRRHEIVSFNHS